MSSSAGGRDGKEKWVNENEREAGVNTLYKHEILCLKSFKK